MITTARLELQQPGAGDFEAYFAIYSDPRTNFFNPSGPMTPERAGPAYQKICSHWEEHDFGLWVISSPESKEIIGFGGLTYMDYGGILRLNLGYRFAADAWGKGYATELTSFGIDFAFSELHADKIYALVRPGHDASIRVLEKCNMRQESTLDDIPGKEPSLIYSIKKRTKK